MCNTYGMGEINPITPTSCEKMTGTRVHHVEHSKKSRDPSFEDLRFYGRYLPIKKHIPNTLVGVYLVAFMSVSCPCFFYADDLSLIRQLQYTRRCLDLFCRSSFYLLYDFSVYSSGIFSVRLSCLTCNFTSLLTSHFWVACQNSNLFFHWNLPESVLLLI